MEFTKGQQLYAEVVQKAWEDEAFKKELIANPVEVIERLTGQQLNIPEGKTLVVRDQTAEDTVYINIPANKEVDAELNEEELESVAGGNAQFPKQIFPIEDIFKPSPFDPSKPINF